MSSWLSYWRKWKHSLPWSPRSNKIAHNTAALYLLMLANYVFPLVVVPYLLRVLGAALYGKIAFSLGLVAYFNIVVDYGFNLSGTRTIARYRDDVFKVSQVSLSVWGIKLALALVGLVALLLLLNVFMLFRGERLLIMILYVSVFGQALFPVWLFQGMERMVFISVINMMTKLGIMIGVFALIEKPADYLLYAVLTSAGALITGILGVGVAAYVFHLRFAVPRMRLVYRLLREGGMVFVSTASVSLYTAGNAFILGLCSSMEMVGYYSVAEKIVKAARQLLTPISNAVYPRFAQLAVETPQRALQWGKRMLVLFGAMGLLISFSLLFSASFIVDLLLGPSYSPTVVVIRILSALPFLIAVSNVLGVQTMLSFGRDRPFALIVVLGGIMNVLLGLLFSGYWDAYGMAWAVVVSETSVTLGTLLYVYRNDLIIKPLFIRLPFTDSGK